MLPGISVGVYVLVAAKLYPIFESSISAECKLTNTAVIAVREV